MPQLSDTDVALDLLARCENQFGALIPSTGAKVAVDAILGFVEMPTAARWEKARRFFVSWSGERYTLNRAALVFAGVRDTAVPTREQVIHTLRAISS